MLLQTACQTARPAAGWLRQGAWIWSDRWESQRSEPGNSPRRGGRCPPDDSSPSDPPPPPSSRADPSILDVTTKADGPAGALPLTDEMLRDWPSGDLFGLTQNAGMGWKPREVDRDPFLILSTQGGLRGADGTPIALGYHTGHWEIGLLVQEAAEELTAAGRRAVRRHGLRPVRRPDAGHGRHDGQPALSQRRGDRLPPADPLAARGARACSASRPATRACRR